MRRALSNREKTLLLVLVIMIIVLGYFKLILEPINSQIDKYNSQAMQEQILIDQQQVKLAQMRRMEKLLEEMKASGNYQAIPSFDNRNAITVELHRVLAQASSYTLNFEETLILEYILARPVSMQFTASSYEAARSIINELHDSDNFNIISDVSIQWDDHRDLSYVSVSLRITYYEVMSDQT